MMHEVEPAARWPPIVPHSARGRQTRALAISATGNWQLATGNWQPASVGSAQWISGQRLKASGGMFP
ncbi:hypothetical protein CXF92_04265 [Pseudomonas sp. Choline-3u-10]|nr:hypothetical protein [Pseudomonas sp.]PKG95527.1 hypothetical protein CXF92_04265 [Pseudomonas sp. Choline-3u-10]